MARPINDTYKGAKESQIRIILKDVKTGKETEIKR